MNAFPDDMEIAPGRTVAEWRKLALECERPGTGDWCKAIEILGWRMRKRFLEPCDSLIERQRDLGRKTFGFAILAIDFLVIETIQGFRCGLVSHKGESQRLVVQFLSNWSAFSTCVPSNMDVAATATKIYQGYRCALHHSGATDGDFRVGISAKRMVEFGSDKSIQINRTIWHEELKTEFGRYLDALRQPDNVDLRRNFVRKMNALCGLT